MAIELVDKIVQAANGDFSLIDDSAIEGGMHVVADDTERDAIPTSRRKEGMFVSVVNSVSNGGVTTLYRLEGGISNSNYTVFMSGGGGGGGVTDLQGAYDGGSDILIGANGGVSIRTSGIAPSPNNPVNLFVKNDIPSSIPAVITKSDDTQPILALGRQVLGDTAVTISGNTIDFGVDLTTLTPPPAVAGVTTNAFTASGVFLDAANVSSEEGIYNVTGIVNGVTTNSAVTVAKIDGSPITFTATSGTASIFNQRSGFNISVSNGIHNAFLTTAEGDGTGIFNALFSDNGNYSVFDQYINAGDLTSGFFVLSNFGPLFGKSADVPFIILDAPLPPDSPDFVFSNRSSDPTTTSLSSYQNGIWWDNILKKYKYWDGSSINILDNINTLQDAYNNGSDIVTVSGTPVTIGSTGNITVFEVGDTTSGFLPHVSFLSDGKISSSPNNSPHFNLSGLTADPAVVDYDVWFNTTDDRLKVRIGANTEEFAYRSDISPVQFAVVDGVGNNTLTFATVKDAVAAGFLDIYVTGTITDNTNITIPTGKTLNVIIRSGASWFISEAEITSVGKSNLIISGEAVENNLSTASSTLIFQTTVGDKYLFNPTDRTNSTITIKNVRLEDTSTVNTLLNGLVNASTQKFENVYWVLPNLPDKAFISLSDINYNVVLNNIEFVGGGTNNYSVINVITGYVRAKGIRFTGTFAPSTTADVIGLSILSTFDDVFIQLSTGGARFGFGDAKVTKLLDSTFGSNKYQFKETVSEIRLNQSTIEAAGSAKINNFIADSVIFTGNNNQFTNGIFTSSFTIDSNGNIFNNVFFDNSVTISGDNNMFTGNRVGILPGGGASTFIISTGALNNTITGALVDTIISDSGTNTLLTAVQVY